MPALACPLASTLIQPPKFLVANMLKTTVCLEVVELQPAHGLGKPLAAISSPCPDGFAIAISCCLPEVSELENTNQAFDSNLAFSTGDIIEMNI